MFEELERQDIWYKRWKNFDPSSASPTNRGNVFKKTNFLCGFCGEQPCESVDHLLPRSKGGLSIPENLIGACFDCNGAKSDMLLEEFREKFFAGKPQPFFFERTSSFLK